MHSLLLSVPRLLHSLIMSLKLSTAECLRESARRKTERQEAARDDDSNEAADVEESPGMTLLRRYNTFSIYRIARILFFLISEQSYVVRVSALVRRRFFILPAGVHIYYCIL